MKGKNVGLVKPYLTNPRVKCNCAKFNQGLESYFILIQEFHPEKCSKQTNFFFANCFM